MNKWYIEILRPNTTSFGTKLVYNNIETRLAELEVEGWIIFSVSAEPHSCSVMITCKKEIK